MGDIRSFRYGPLTHSQIRLFKLNLSEVEGPLSGILITFRLTAFDEFTLKSIFGSVLSSDAWHNTAFAERKGQSGFDALSYVWGSAEKTYPLKLSSSGKVYIKTKLCADGNITGCGAIRIQHNLYTLLQQFRRTRYDRFIWIDSICINQNDQGEKGDQIPLMRHIYREANNVVVW